MSRTTQHIDIEPMDRASASVLYRESDHRSKAQAVIEVRVNDELRGELVLYGAEPCIKALIQDLQFQVQERFTVLVESGPVS